MLRNVLVIDRCYNFGFLLCIFSVKMRQVEGTSSEIVGNFDLGFDANHDIQSLEQKKKKLREFKESTNDYDINQCSKKRFAPESRRKMKWAVNLYNDWRDYRLKLQSPPVEIGRSDLNFVGSFTQDDLCFSLSRFIREIKRIDGSDYPPSTQIIIMVQMHLNENDVYWKLLENEKFLGLRNVVDNTMKERTAQGLGLRSSSEIISLNQEDVLFNSGALGDKEPLQLLHTVIYMMGLHLALPGGVEHNRLRRPGFDPQVIVGNDARGRECLIYTEDALNKTNQGGLKCKQRTKVVYVYPSANLFRCPVRIYKKYIGLLPKPKSCKKLYLRVKPKQMPYVWYADQPFGVNKVCSAVKEICNKAGITGKFMNHSLRATSASRMYHKGVPEQVIKEVTGHASDSVRTYKRTSEEIREIASNTIAGQGETSEKNENIPNLEEANSEVKECVINTKHSNIHSKSKKKELSMLQMVKNVLKTKAEIAQNRMGSSSKFNKCKRMLANKILKQTKAKKFASRVTQKNRNITIDLNVNVNFRK